MSVNTYFKIQDKDKLEVGKFLYYVPNQIVLLYAQCIKTTACTHYMRIQNNFIIN